MTFANGTIGEIIKALDISGVEMLAISLPDSRIVDATHCLMRRWCCNKYQMVGKQLSQSANSEFHARYVDEGVTGVSTKADTRIEITFKSGTASAISTRFKPQHLRDDGADYLLLINPHEPAESDVSDTETQARLELAVKAGGYGSWAFDFQGDAHEISPELYEILGYEPNDPKLKFDDFEDRIHPDDKAETLGASMKREPKAKYWHCRMRFLNAKDVYIWIEQIAAIVRDPLTGSNVKAIGLIRDVTERMESIQQIEASQRNLARSQSIARIGSWVVDLQTNQISWSDQMYTILGLERHNGPVTFEPLLDMMPEPHRARWRESMEIARSTGRHTSFEIFVEAGPDDQRQIEVHIDGEFDKDGNVRELHGICRDVSEQSLLERKFLQAQKMESVGRLTGGIAHDFNNLLMVMIGNLQLVEQMVKDEPNILKRLTTAIDAANKGSELTKRMLAFSRQQSVEDEQIAVNELVGGMNEMLSRAIGGNIKLAFDMGKDVWNVEADRTQLETAILNLGINSRDAMPNGGKLKVQTENVVLNEVFCARHERLRPGDYVKISVTDTGHGMPEEIIEKVTEPFFTTKPVDKGSGLGLSMIFGFVKQSNGHLDITSKVDSGTTISIYLPRAALDACDTTKAANTSGHDDHVNDEVVTPQEETTEAAIEAAETPVRQPLVVENKLPDLKNLLSENSPVVENQAEADKAEVPSAPQPSAEDTISEEKPEGPAVCGNVEPSPQPEAEPVQVASEDSPVVQEDEAAEEAPALSGEVETSNIAESKEPEEVTGDQIEQNAESDETGDEPVASEDDEPVDSSDPAPSTGRKLILVVEDNDAVRDVAIAMLEDMDWDVLEADNGAAGLKLIEEHPEIDLLLSDVVMPGMNGPELAALVQKIRPNLPVLFASGYTQGASEEIKELPNFIELINKPFTRDDLTSKVSAVLEGLAEKAA